MNSTTPAVDVSNNYHYYQNYRPTGNMHEAKNRATKIGSLTKLFYHRTQKSSQQQDLEETYDSRLDYI